MDAIEQQLAEIEQLKAKQALHRQQLAENRQRALEKKNYTKRLVDIGKMVLEFLPDASTMNEAEIREVLKKILSKQQVLWAFAWKPPGWWTERLPGNQCDGQQDNKPGRGFHARR